MIKAVAIVIALILMTGLALQGGGPGSVPKGATAFDLGYHNDKVDALQMQFDPNNTHPYVWTKIQIGDMEVDINTILQNLVLFNTGARAMLNRMHFDDHYRAVPVDSFNEIQGEWDWLSGVLAANLGKECEPNLNNDQLDRLLLKMGEGLHMVEDFYSHSDYVELLDALGVALPLPTWDDLNQPGNAGIKNALMNGVVITPQNRPATGQLPVDADAPTPLYTGAYRDDPAQGPPRQLTHGSFTNRLLHPFDGELNKDGPDSVEGGVVSPHYPNNTYFDLAYDLAKRASIQWMNKFQGWMGNDCWSQVLSYNPSLFSKIGINIKWGASVLAAKAFGHWKSGEPNPVSGLSSEIDLGYSPSYPDADPSTLLSSPPTYTYEVHNLGATAVDSFHIEMASGGGSLLGSVTPPPGWTWQLSGDSLDFQTNVASLGPDAVATFGVSCNSCDIREAQAVLDRTDGSVDAPLDVIGPGPPSDIMLEEASILSEMSVPVGGTEVIGPFGHDGPPPKADIVFGPFPNAVLPPPSQKRLEFKGTATNPNPAQELIIEFEYVDNLGQTQVVKPNVNNIPQGAQNFPVSASMTLPFCPNQVSIHFNTSLGSILNIQGIFEHTCSKPVGGTTELLVGASDDPTSVSEGSGSAGGTTLPITAAAGGALVALAAGGWYVRRRLRQRVR
jgi:hypothetical protein